MVMDSNAIPETWFLTRMFNCSPEKFPPYNIKKIATDRFLIEMAVAGFGINDIVVKLDGAKLTMTGAHKKNKAIEKAVYYFKGIPEQSFSRTFMLADHIEVMDVFLVDGMLQVWLDYLSPTRGDNKIFKIKQLTSE